MGNRIIYADVLRVLAIVSIMVIHVGATSFGDLDPASYEWNILNVFVSSARWGVPMFVMISGMFFLNPERTVPIKRLYTKYIPRIVMALIVWAFIYEVYKGILDQTLNLLYIKESFERIFQTDTHYHLWFMYMIIGLYTVTPILRTFIKGASKKDLEYFLLISFIFTSLLPTLDYFEPFHTITPFIIKFHQQVNLVLGYTLYFILGYYLATYSLTKNVRTILYILGIISYLTMVFGTRLFSLEKGDPNTFLYDNLQVNVFLMSVALFVFGKEILGKITYSETSLKVIAFLSKYSFGMYLIHDMMRTLLIEVGLDNLSFNPLLAVPVVVTCIFILSMIGSFLIKNIPFIGKYIT